VCISELVISVAAGYFDHGIAVTSDGSIVVWGENYQGALGLGPDPIKISIPETIPNTKGFKSVVAGVAFSLALDQNGFVWGFGENRHGELGVGDKNPRFTPTKNDSLTNINQLACGPKFSFALDKDGNAWGFGANAYGQLAIGQDAVGEDQLIPRKALFEIGISKIAAGDSFCMALDLHRRLWGCGDNSWGSLAIGAQLITCSVPQPVDFLGDVMQVWCGGNCTFVTGVEISGVWAAGGSSYGQLGVGDFQFHHRFTPVSLPCVYEVIPCGNHTLFITSNGDVYAAGRNGKGQLGLGEVGNTAKYTLVPDLNMLHHFSHVKSAAKTVPSI
jgi:alpha-tubulin suppressor-like RCC1 family protein